MGKLTEAEQNKLIDDVMSGWEMPFDKDEPQRAKAKIMAMARESQPVIQMSQKSKVPMMRIAAAIIILLALPLTILLLGNTQIKNATQITHDHTLPNGSKITLNPGAKIAYNRFTWSFNRNVEFEGEGYFDVVSGSSFEISTNKGHIYVLGTTFTVWADQDDLMVHCASGAVKVASESNTTTLGPGEIVQHNTQGFGTKMNFEHTGFYAPHTISEELEFDQVPLQLVLHELELILKKEFVCNLKADNLTYSGRINPSDMNTCLDVLCKPFNAKHKIDQDGSVVIYE